MSFNIPNTFIAGTKAKADEVNENFTAIKDELNAHSANMQTIQTNLDTLDNYVNKDLTNDIVDIANSIKTKFAVNYGNLDENSNEDILYFENLTVKFKVGGSYPLLIATNAFGESETYELIDDIDFTGCANGVYNLFIDLSGKVEKLNNTIYRQPSVPIGPIIDDVWFMNMEPNHCYKYNGTSWIDYEGIPLGSVVIEEAAIKSVETFRFNQRGKMDTDCTNLTQAGRNNLSKRYETGWFTMYAMGTFTITHNLNLPVEKYKVRMLAKIRTSMHQWMTDNVICFDYVNTGLNATKEMGFALALFENVIHIAGGNNNTLLATTKHDQAVVNLEKSHVVFKVIVTEDVN